MKKILIALVLCLAMVSLIATPAFAATQKRDLVQNSTGYAVGYATFITNEGDNALVVKITLKGALQKAKYDVYLDIGGDLIEPFDPSNKIGSLITNSRGNWGGQNEQYEFEKVLPPNTYNVDIWLVSWDKNNPSTAVDIIQTSPGITVIIK